MPTTCHGCGQAGHYKANCPMRSSSGPSSTSNHNRRHQNGRSQAAINMTTVEAHEFDPHAFPLVVIPLNAAGTKFEALVDNGANVNVVSEEALDKIRLLDPTAVESEERVSEPVPVRLALGESEGSGALGQVVVRITVGAMVHSIRATIVRKLARDFFLGIPWMAKFKPHMDWEQYTLSWTHEGQDFEVKAKSKPSPQLLAELEEPLLGTVQINAEKFIKTVEARDTVDAGVVW
ncbi:hypothetical protein BGZ47_004802, partial [Haplosporangium gracile]